MIIGGGLAGLAVAHHLARAGAGRVVLLEREPLLASHATARNAAIFLPVERDEASMRLAARQALLLDGLFGGRAWLEPRGALLVADRAESLLPATQAAQAGGLECALMGEDALFDAVPVLREGRARHALQLPGSGVLDAHAIVEALSASARAGGVEVRLVSDVRRVVLERGRASGVEHGSASGVQLGSVSGVEVADGTSLTTRHLVIAGGAWSEGIAASAGLGLPLAPRRRHLVWMEAPQSAPEFARGPVVWAVEDEVYFRPESGGVLASPCDETPHEAGVPETDPAALDLLARKLRALAPRLLEGGVRRAWGCLRTFAPDRVSVAGADPRVEGLSWLAGLGGQGMTLGLAAAEVTAAAVLGAPHALSAALGPARLLDGRGDASARPASAT